MKKRSLYKYYILFYSSDAISKRSIYSYAIFSQKRTAKQVYSEYAQKIKKQEDELTEKYNVSHVYAVVVPFPIMINESGELTKRDNMEEAYKNMPSYAMKLTENFYIPEAKRLYEEYLKTKF